MTHVTWRLTAKKRDQLRNPTMGMGYVYLFLHHHLPLLHLRLSGFSAAGMIASNSLPDLTGDQFYMSTQNVIGRSQSLARWPGTHSRILSGIQRAAQTVLGMYLKRTSSCVTSASSALGVLNDYVLYKSTHSLTHSLISYSCSL